MSSTERAKDLKIAAAFGERVRAIRLEQEMTQEQLAEVAGLHPTFISNLERGYRVPTLVTIIKVARGLRVSPESLVTGIASR